MKRFVVLFSFILMSIFAYGQGGLRSTNETRRIRLTVWSNTNGYGTAKVYCGGKYMGRITKFYSSDPGVGASGCVTFEYTVNTPSQSVIRVESDEGVIWHIESYHDQIRYKGNSGGTLRAYCRGEKAKGSSSSSSRSNSQSYSNGSGNSYSSSRSYSSSDDTAERIGRNIGETIGGGITSGFGAMGGAVREGIDIQMDGYPNLQLQLQASTFFAEMATLTANLGGAAGFYLSGGVGYTLFKEPEYQRKLGWIASLGYYVSTGDNGNLTLGFTGGRSHKYDTPYIGINVDYAYFFNPRLGVFAGAGIGIADVIRLDAHIGITCRVLMKKQRYYY